MKIVDEKILAEHRWLLFKERIFIDRFDEKRSWAYVERRNRLPAAAIIARTAETGSLILVLQNRVPFDGPVLEFPAGLIEPGEDPAAAALRELTEETGYRGRVVSVSSPAASSAGLTNETIFLVAVETEELPSAPLEHSESEEIEVIRCAPDELAGIAERAEREAWMLDAKLATFLSMHAFSMNS